MGSSSSKYGGIFVQTDKPYYQPGDTVTGHVYVDMHSTFPTSTIYLKVKGYEKVHFKEKRTDDKGNVYYDHYKDKNQFYSHKFKLHTWGSNIPAGQFSIPFSFVLQDHLPGTFYEDDQPNNYTTSIRYTIKSETDVPKGFDKLKNKQELVVREKVKGASKPAEGEMIKDTKTWCCISQGESKIKSYFEYNSYMPGETANIITEIDNSQCKLNIENVVGELIKVVKLQAKSHNFRKELSVSSTKFGKIDAGETKLGEKALRTPVTLISSGKPIQPSTNGSLVQCNYYLRVSSDMEGVTCCAEDPNVRIPIQIVAPPPTNYGKVEQPANWNPQSLGNVNISFTSDAMYQPKQGDANVTINTSTGFGMTSPPSMNMTVNTNTGYQPPQQQGFNQPPQQQQGFNQPPQQQQGFNQPPQQQQGFNQPPQQQQGFNQPPQNNQNQNADVNVKMDMGMGMGMGMQFNAQASDSNFNNGNNNQGQNGNVQMNFNM
ncbi:Immunoglobulin E-set [Pseudocohnilembus persalinus]|uniref:Immunoglobulin E-set n=1 Tax=Pseudocohnilembus persalinus TaxID=266149 RepID=A0A0V0R0R5_PSEPJ|nr:Immunoglobulin E-set [Pseudocohnilembus persalinus]|eukprot:KRX08116.1 Immunoglobulin E-set [Pseudocohnilembus persalinus]